MKNLLYCLWALLSLFSLSYANHDEMNIITASGRSIKIWRNNVYTHYGTTGAHGTQYTNCGSGTSTFFLSVGPDAESSAYGQPLEEETEYTIIIDGRAQVLKTSTRTYPQGDFTIFFDGNSFSIQVCQAYNPQLVGETSNWDKLDVTVKNSFDAGTVTVDYSDYSSGTVFGWTNGTSHRLTAVDRTYYGDYYRIFSNWSGLVNGSNSTVTFNISAPGTVNANFLKEYNIIFQNGDLTGSLAGTVKVNNTQYGSPTSSFAVTENTNIRGTAVSPQISNHLIFTFSNWSPGNVQSEDNFFTPANRTTYTANFTMKPEMVEDLHTEGDAGDQVGLYWTDNPNQYVSQYEIYRSWNKGAAYQHVATVNRGIEYWYDEACQFTFNYIDSLVHYRVVGKYSHDGINADSDSATTSIYGKEGYEMKARDGVPAFKGSKPTASQYSIGNYPNPFNPTTMIVYDLVEDSDVKLDIYDVSGRLITTLVDAKRTAGDHATVWRGTDKSGKSVASGMYFYRIVARPLSGHEPFMKSGKLILMK